MNSVLITGGTGSFGQAFVTRLLRENLATRIIIFSRGEHLQEDMERRFNDDRLRFFIGDVRDRDRLELAMRNVDTVVHAAALKVVPIAEYNPTECVRTNIHGAENVVTAAIRSGVRRVVALSTDKAVSPINLYGASKLAAEKIFTAANALAAGSCHFNVVRYGNVAGSRGSVLPLFKKFKEENKPFTITDEAMTRFWITLDQSVSLVLSAIDLAKSGLHSKTLIPKIPSILITDLAKAIDPDRKIKIIGIRPGEKLHECLMTADEARTAAEWAKFFIIHESKYMFNPEETQLTPGFNYSSDTNTDWLSVEQLRSML